MKLREKAALAFEDLCLAKWNPIDRKYQAEKKKIESIMIVDGVLFQEPHRFNLYCKWAKEYATEIVDAWVDALIETFSTVRQYPDEEDLQFYAEGCIRIAVKYKDFVPGVYKGVFSAVPKEIV